MELPDLGAVLGWSLRDEGTNERMRRACVQGAV